MSSCAVDENKYDTFLFGSFFVLSSIILTERGVRQLSFIGGGNLGKHPPPGIIGRYLLGYYKNMKTGKRKRRDFFRKLCKTKEERGNWKVK
jgi:hypothetical protein